MSRKKDLCSMMRQLGKPTYIISNETKWSTFIQTLHKLKYGKDIEGHPLKLNAVLRSTLVMKILFVYYILINWSMLL